MPELPEVEALRRGLVKYLIDSKILDVKVLQEKLIAGKGTTRKASPEKTKEFISKLKNKKIISIERRAKNLIFTLDTKEIILVHLKMTGQLVFTPTTPSPSSGRRGNSAVLGGHPIQESELKLPHKHTYIIFKLDNGNLYYNDVRQFGYVLYFPTSPKASDGQVKILEEHFKGLGLEPFDKNFTLKYFKEKIEEIKKKKSTVPIKKLLLDQTVVVGCGNIYCDEVCWASSVLPMRPVRSLKDEEIKKIYENIKKILDKAINSGGSSVANYLLADGKRGNYTDYHNVYQKDGAACKFKGCKGIIEKITFAGRGTHFCPVHQK
jgi:formamidopyrimidine-DNA glycosylase